MASASVSAHIIWQDKGKILDSNFMFEAFAILGGLSFV